MRMRPSHSFDKCLCVVRVLKMLKFGTFFAIALAFTTAVPTNVLQLDLTPEEAQKYLNSPPFTEPKLAGRTAVLPLIRYNDPRFRSAEAGPTLGHYWKNGREIENPEDYVEEVSVRYWADSQGFHQEDNIPKVVLKPVEEAEDVRQARLAHEKAWQEAAAAARVQPDPQGEYNPQNDYQPAASEQQSAYVAAPGQVSQAREGKAYYGAQDAYQTGAQAYPTPYPEKIEEPEPTGPPRGFFYSFNYPTSILVAKKDLQGGSANPGYPVDQDTYSINAKQY
ncbi:uncharacterized protein LOC119831213 [Zerene cesonia]|uniref:uncharacterized protein LOC119831213 n=1 Tax=Zerene cesonia TaxID=33412 RepID=UPI0018E57E16|nr:uncharacterized protein LOC119831213 [Zerene cesonia]